MRFSLLVPLALGACSHGMPAAPTAPSAPTTPPIEVAVPKGVAAGITAIGGDAHWAYLQRGAWDVTSVDWQARTAANIADEAKLVEGGPLILRQQLAGTKVEQHFEWPGGSVLRPSGAGAIVAAVRTDAAVPAVTVDHDAHIIKAAGWHADGTRAWHLELDDTRGTEVRRVFYLGDLVVFQTVGAASATEHYPPGTTLALDAATGAVRWRHDLVQFGAFPIAERIAAHGDEIALAYDSPRNEVHVLARADGHERRMIHLDGAIALGSAGYGFDGDVVWFFSRTPPASCGYVVYDTRHDRGKAIRNASTSAARAAFEPTCTAVGMLGLPDGRVQLVAQAGTDRLALTTFDRAP